MSNLKQPKWTIGSLISLFLFILLACSLPGQAQIEGGVATAQAAAVQASDFATRTAPTLQAAAVQASDFATRTAPTLQAAAEQARDLATRSAPTIEALSTQAVIFATESAPTLEASVQQLGTVAAEARESGQVARATLDAAGIDAQYLIRKVGSLRPDENGNINFTMTEVEINLVLQAREIRAQGEGETPNATSPTVNLSEGVIKYEADVTSPFSGHLTVLMQPYVTDGNLQLSLLSADLGGQQVPQFLLGTAEATLNSTLNGALNQLPQSVELSAVFVNEGSMTVVATRLP